MWRSLSDEKEEAEKMANLMLVARLVRGTTETLTQAWVRASAASSVQGWR